jgi:hypothetical protein
LIEVIHGSQVTVEENAAVVRQVTRRAPLGAIGDQLGRIVETDSFLLFTGVSEPILR